MTTGDFDQYYSDEPFSIMDQNQRTWLDPDLIDIWRLRSVFRPIVSFTKSLSDVRATSMTITQLLDPHPDFTALSARQIWMPSMHVDSRAVEVSFAHYGGKVAYHKYDDMVTYWKKNGKAGVRAIARGALGTHFVDVNDMLARNAILDQSLDTGYQMFIEDRADFSAVQTTDLYDPDIGADIWLGMANRGVAQALGPSGADGSIIAYTSPGVIYDIQGNENWKTTREYLQDRILLQYEVGAHKNVRYVQTPKCTLWNCGTVLFRAEISAAAHAGDGSPNPSTTKVDGTYKTGQTSGGIVHYLQLAAPTTGSMGTISVNDIITIHKTVTSDHGVTDGVDYREGTLMNRRVVSVDTNTRRVALDTPILIDYDTDLGSGVYGYVTLGRNIHATIFVGGPQAVVSGVAQQPQFYELDPIDDFKAIYRFSWDQYLGFAPYRPEVLEVVYSAGSHRVKGPRKVQ